MQENTNRDTQIPIYLQFLVRLLFPLTSNIYAKDNQSDYYTLSD